MKAPEQPDRSQADAFVLVLRPVPGNWQAPPEKRLARLLKYALRATGLRCVRCEPARPVAAENFRGKISACAQNMAQVADAGIGQLPTQGTPGEPGC